MDVMAARTRWRGWGRVLAVVLVFVASSAPALASDGGKDGAGVEFFEQRIRPLLVKHCYECHGPDAKKLRGELRLDTRAGVLEGGATGPAVVPGKPEQSLLIKAVRHADKDLRMPPKARLSAAEIADL